MRTGSDHLARDLILHDFLMLGPWTHPAFGKRIIRQRTVRFAYRELDQESGRAISRSIPRLEQLASSSDIWEEQNTLGSSCEGSSKVEAGCPRDVIGSARTGMVDLLSDHFAVTVKGIRTVPDCPPPDTASVIV